MLRPKAKPSPPPSPSALTIDPVIAIPLLRAATRSPSSHFANPSIHSPPHPSPSPSNPPTPLRLDSRATLFPRGSRTQPATTHRAPNAPASHALTSRSVDLSVDVGKLSFSNPIIAASGTFGYGVEFAHLVDLNRLGGIVTKGLSLEPMKGAPPPRIIDSDGGMINAIGLQNIGVRAFVSLKLPQLRQCRTQVVCNVFGHTRIEYSRLVEVLEGAEGIAAYEINLSCPNVEAGGMEFGFDPVALSAVVGDVRRLTQREIWVKLPPAVGYIAMLAKAAEQAGADALTIANSYPAAALDLNTKRPILGSTGGGLSGTSIRPITLRLVAQAKAAVRIPVVGLGGIETAEDAIEYLLAGASAVQIGTAHFIDPRASERVVSDLEQWMIDNKLNRISDLK